MAKKLSNPSAGIAGIDEYNIKPQYLLQDAMRLDENLNRYARKRGIKREDVGDHLKKELGDDLDRALSLIDLKLRANSKKDEGEEIEIKRKNRRKK